MSKNNITPELLKIIKKSIDDAAKKAAEAVIKANEEVGASQKNYFRDTEKLLYSYPALKIALSQYDEELEKGIVLSGKSKDIIRFSPGSGTPDPDVIVDATIQSKIASIERTRAQVQRIERALETIQDDEYYDIIPMKYWDQLQPAEIAERLNCDERTYRRHKNRLINKIKIVLFGADAI